MYLEGYIYGQHRNGSTKNAKRVDSKLEAMQGTLDNTLGLLYVLYFSSLKELSMATTSDVNLSHSERFFGAMGKVWMILVLQV